MTLVRRQLALIRLPVISVVIALAASTGILVSVGENPKVLFEALYNTLFTGFGLGHTLYYATPYIFTGLAVAVASHCGLFNIGAEGQLYLGALGIILVGGEWLPSLPWPLSIVAALIAAALFGAILGGIAGLLKATRGSHEVIVTILLNFVGMAIVSYCILNPLKNPLEQNPETIDLGTSYFLSTFDSLLSPLGIAFFATTPVNTALLLALLGCFAVHFFLLKTTYGYEMRAVGASSRAAQFAGISVTFNTVLAMAMGGALAGMGAVNDVMGYHHRLIEGFSPGYGFTGIAVAMLVKNRPLGIPFSAFLFGALQNSARELEFLSDKVSKELALLLQGLLIGVVAAEYLIDQLLKRVRKGETHD